MTWDWMPGVALAVVGNGLTLWRGAAVTEEKVAELRRELDKHEAQNADILAVNAREMRESYERLNEIFTEVKLLAREQAIFNQVCTKTLEGIAKKFEFHDLVLTQQTTDIAVLKTEVSKSGRS